MCAGSYIVGL
ncbi:hypothetical protein BsWGS_05522 [Bradybaena similaris]